MSPLIRVSHSANLQHQLSIADQQSTDQQLSKKSSWLKNIFGRAEINIQQLSYIDPFDGSFTTKLFSFERDTSTGTFFFFLFVSCLKL